MRGCSASSGSVQKVDLGNPRTEESPWQLRDNLGGQLGEEMMRVTTVGPLIKGQSQLINESRHTIVSLQYQGAHPL